MSSGRWVVLGAALLVASLALAPEAPADTWAVGGSVSSPVVAFDFADLAVTFDASGRGTVGLLTRSGWLPLIRRTATTFSISSTFFSFDAACATWASFSGTAPIVTGDGVATASGTLVGSGVEECERSSTPFLIAGSFTARSADPDAASPVIAAITAVVLGAVTYRTPFDARAVTPGTALEEGGLLETGGDGSVTFDVTGGVRIAATPATRVTLLPPVGGDAAVNQISGRLDHSRPGGAAGSFRVQTGTATVRATGTDFTTQYSQAGDLGVTTVAVQSGHVEVEGRQGQRLTLLAGQTASFEDAVPRVLLILPVDGGVVREGVVNVFSWSAFPGAAGYLFEYTLAPGGFAARNPAGPENARLAIPLFPPAIAGRDSTVEFPLPMPVGLAPRGTRGHWRVFPLDAAGRILPGSVASDAAVEAIQ